MFRKVGQFVKNFPAAEKEQFENTKRRRRKGVKKDQHFDVCREEHECGRAQRKRLKMEYQSAAELLWEAMDVWLTQKEEERNKTGWLEQRKVPKEEQVCCTT